MSSQDTITNAYYQMPSFSHNKLVYCTDDDLWLTNIDELSNVKRLTNSEAHVSWPHIHPDASCVAYLNNQQGQNDIYLLDISSGQSKRLTYRGVNKLSGWYDDEHLLFSSAYDNFSLRFQPLYKVNIESLKVTALNLGPASQLCESENFRVLGRNLGDPARWKRYRGGTAGTLWVAKTKSTDFRQILKNLKSNLSNPLIINDRIYFISDHEGIGNIYSCTSTGRTLKRHTNFDEYYVRSFSYHTGTIIMQAGGLLYKLDLNQPSEKVTLIDFKTPSSFNQSIQRIEDADEFLQEYTLTEGAQKIVLVSRGQLFIRSPWADSPIRLGTDHRRYRLPTEVFLKDDTTSILCVELNEENEETLILFSDLNTCLLNNSGKKIATKQDWGKILFIEAAHEKNEVIIANNRNELFHLNIKNSRVKKISKEPYRFYDHVSWSPCDTYIAFSESTHRTCRTLFIYDFKEQKKVKLLPEVLEDFHPSFCPDGDYLFFVSMREFRPNYSESHFEIAFPFATNVYALALNKKVKPINSLHQNYEYDDEEDESEDEDENTSKSKKRNFKKQVRQRVHIDLNGIEDRIMSLGLEFGGHTSVSAVEDKVFIEKAVISGLDPYDSNSDQHDSSLYTYCLKEKKIECFQKSCYGHEVSRDKKYVIMDCEEGLRLSTTDSKPTEGLEYGKKDGYVNLSNIKLNIEPKKEWLQMYQEAWILQREHFWVPDMSKVEWENVYDKYLTILERIHTRRELSDLLWEMQGELGTSHCYEMGGDYYRRARPNQNGHLNASLKWNKSKKALEIIEIAKGDSWVDIASSPLRAPGVSLMEKDIILGIDGWALTNEIEFERALEARTNKESTLTIKRHGARQIENVTIRPKQMTCHARYRDWINKNVEYVHKKSKGKLGYVHIPNMSLWGVSEFYRNFLKESAYEGLVVDVRYNGGGNVSQHILKVLAQKVVGFDQTRYMGTSPYPEFAINGPIVAITNEHAGSDGDIFSHSFKLMNIGPLIGKRTWGGVIGIWPRHRLNDGTMTTQPEFSFWFKDVGYEVENYGTEPDIEVEITPEDWAKGRDPQLDRAISEGLKRSKTRPVLRPNLMQNRPKLRPPKFKK